VKVDRLFDAMAWDFLVCKRFAKFFQAGKTWPFPNGHSVHARVQQKETSKTMAHKVTIQDERHIQSHGDVSGCFATMAFL